MTSTMPDIQERLRSLFQFPATEDPFDRLLMCWRRFTTMPVALRRLTWARLHRSLTDAR